jgi:LysR family nod box-dependent transcriptional activator
VALEALLRTRSVSATAVELRLTQPAVSSALARLRGHFGDEILVFTGGEMTPTQFGRGLAHVIPDTIAQLRPLARMRANFDPSSLHRTFKIISSDYVSQVLLSRVSRRLALVAPKVSLQVISFSETAASQFDRGNIEFQIAPEFLVFGKHGSEVLFRDNFRCIVSTKNRLAENGLDLSTFMRLPHVVTSFGTNDGKSHFERELDAQAIHISVAAKVPSFVLLPHFVIGTQNIATVHRRLIEELPPELPLRYFDPPINIPDLTEILIWNKYLDRDVEAMWLRDLIIETGRSLDAPRSHSPVQDRQRSHADRPRRDPNRRQGPIATEAG